MTRWTIEKDGTGIEKSGTGIEKDGTGIEKSGTGIEKSGTGIRKRSIGTYQWPQLHLFPKQMQLNYNLKATSV